MSTLLPLWYTTVMSSSSTCGLDPKRALLSLQFRCPLWRTLLWQHLDIHGSRVLCQWSSSWVEEKMLCDFGKVRGINERHTRFCWAFILTALLTDTLTRTELNPPSFTAMCRLLRKLKTINRAEEKENYILHTVLLECQSYPKFVRKKKKKQTRDKLGNSLKLRKTHKSWN